MTTGNIDTTTHKFRHICEVCGKDEFLTPDESFQEGWDYPPKTSPFGIVSPRTCGKCTVNETLWWALIVNQTSVSDLTESQTETLHRIIKEPASISIEGK